MIWKSSKAGKLPLPALATLSDVRECVDPRVLGVAGPQPDPASDLFIDCEEVRECLEEGDCCEFRGELKVSPSCVVNVSVCVSVVMILLSSTTTVCSCARGDRKSAAVIARLPGAGEFRPRTFSPSASTEVDCVSSRALNSVSTSKGISARVRWTTRWTDKTSKCERLPSPRFGPPSSSSPGSRPPFPFFCFSALPFFPFGGMAQRRRSRETQI